MTSVEHWRSALASTDSQVSIAGVPWPTYKLLALTVGMIVLFIVGVATSSAAAAVLTGAGSSTALWIVLGWARRRS